MENRLNETQKTELLKLLETLVGIPSVNTGLNQGGVPEAGVAEFISDYLRQIGMTIEILRMPDGRPNIWARWPAKNQKPSLVLSAHMDTVNIDGMTIDPFKIKMEDGKVYGRGTCDTKGSLAVYLWTLRQIADRHDAFDRDIQFLATCNEENGCVGSQWLANRKFAADEMIVGEPTNCEVAVAHRGELVIEIQTRGLSTHASVPEKGRNAIYAMSDFIQHIHRNWLGKLATNTHPLLGSATAAITIIHGGFRYNIVPDQCRATMDVRFVPGQKSQDIMADLRAIIESLQIDADIELAEDKPALSTNPDLPFVQNLLQACNKVTGKAKPTGVPYLADSSQFAKNGIKCVLFGPGDIAHAHSKDEFLELEQLYNAANILLHFFSR